MRSFPARACRTWTTPKAALEVKPIPPALGRNGAGKSSPDPGGLAKADDGTLQVQSGHAHRLRRTGTR